MANTITNLVSRPVCGSGRCISRASGLYPAVARNSTAERAAVGEAVRYPIAPSNTTSNISPAMTVS